MVPCSTLLFIFQCDFTDVVYDLQLISRPVVPRVVSRNSIVQSRRRSPPIGRRTLSSSTSPRQSTTISTGSLSPTSTPVSAFPSPPVLMSAPTSTSASRSASVSAPSSSSSSSPASRSLSTSGSSSSPSIEHIQFPDSSSVIVHGPELIFQQRRVCSVSFQWPDWLEKLYLVVSNMQSILTSGFWSWPRFENFRADKQWCLVGDRDG